MFLRGAARSGRFGSLFRILVLALAAVPTTAQSQTLRIVGGLSNFDCYNDSPSDCSGFEIEISGLSSSDVAYTWNYSAFGAPTITTLTTAAGTSVLVRYSSATAVVRPGTFTHFGVVTRLLPDPAAVQRRWIPKAPAVPPQPVILPDMSSELVTNSNGVTVVRDGIFNPEPDDGRTFWILPFANIIPRAVVLEELTTDDPIVTTSVPLGGGPDGLTPERLDPQDTWTNDDAVGADDEQSAVTSYEVFEDVVTFPGGVETHSPGRRIATIMNATVTAPTQVVPEVAPKGIRLALTALRGGRSTTATIRLLNPAPAGGGLVRVASNSPTVTVPETVNFAAGVQSATIAVNTTPVTRKKTVTISVTGAGVTKSATLTVNP